MDINKTMHYKQSDTIIIMVCELRDLIHFDNILSEGSLLSLLNNFIGPVRSTVVRY